MANTIGITFFENKLQDFVTAKDPVLKMMQWVMDKFMEIEVAHKTGAEKGIFPSTDSYIRLITSYLLEYTEDWQTERAYMNSDSIQSQKEILFNAA